MAFTSGPQTGLPTNIDPGDTTWTQKILDGNKALEARISKKTTGDPNGVVVGDFYGQTCYASSSGDIYECVFPGNATNAEWVLKSYVEVGSVQFFLLPAVPAGWLALAGGTFNNSSYPRLAAVLPSSMKTSTTFTLPNLKGQVLTFRDPIGNEPLPNPGQLNSDIGKVAASGINTIALLNVRFGIKY